jgi:hypothetical protein
MLAPRRSVVRRYPTRPADALARTPEQVGESELVASLASITIGTVEKEKAPTHVSPGLRSCGCWMGSGGRGGSGSHPAGVY